MPTVNHPPVMKVIMKHASKSSMAFGIVYRIIGGFLYAATSSLKRVSGRIFTISSVFIEASQNLSFIFSITRQQKNLKTIGAYTESTDLIFTKKLFISVTQSL
jgi:hypothetical protein